VELAHPPLPGYWVQRYVGWGMILLAFDIDGTLDTSAGPVAWAKVRALEAVGIWVHLGLVSPSGNGPKDGTPVYLAPSEQRVENLLMFARAFPTALWRLYVGDTPDDAAAAVAAGWGYSNPENFARGLP
jgi:hypothetical protein